jgi:hypothetical protein
MAQRATPGEPYVGQRVFLGGDITYVGGEESAGLRQVTIRLDKFEYPITIQWTEPDGVSLALPEET